MALIMHYSLRRPVIPDLTIGFKIQGPKRIKEVYDEKSIFFVKESSLRSIQQRRQTRLRRAMGNTWLFKEKDE